jgi:DNA-directed RNA polymerase specialized sigma24 family protein
MAADVHRVFEAVVITLDAPTAEVVRMRLRDGLSFKQIAEQQGTPINTALGRMHRALKRIRQALMDEELIDNGRQR